MNDHRNCKSLSVNGVPCKARPQHESDYCLFHDPRHADSVQKARRAGGLRRKKEAVVATTYDCRGLETIEDILRLVEVAAYDALALENSLGRVRVLGYLAQVATTILEKGETQTRLAAIEAALGPRLVAATRRQP